MSIPPDSGTIRLVGKLHDSRLREKRVQPSGPGVVRQEQGSATRAFGEGRVHAA